MQGPGAPAISVIVPDCGGTETVEKCLERFAAQTVPADQFELIPGGPHLADTGAADIWMARNALALKARAPLLVLYSAALRPLPGLLEYCLDFHQRHPALHHAMLPGFAADSVYRRLHPAPLPSATGIQSWQAFQTEAVTCKAELFRHGQFDAAYGCLAGQEFALRLSRRMDLTLFHEGVITGERTEAISPRAACEAHYLAAYYEYLLACAYPGAVMHARAEVVDQKQLAAMVSAIRGMERTAADAESPRHKMLTALYSRIEEHARAEGWAAAQNGQPPNPPGSLGPLLK